MSMHLKCQAKHLYLNFQWFLYFVLSLLLIVLGFKAFFFFLFTTRNITRVSFLKILLIRIGIQFGKSCHPPTMQSCILGLNCVWYVLSCCFPRINLKFIYPFISGMMWFCISLVNKDLTSCRLFFPMLLHSVSFFSCSFSQWNALDCKLIPSC